MESSFEKYYYFWKVAVNTNFRNEIVLGRDSKVPRGGKRHPTKAIYKEILLTYEKMY